MPLTLSFLGRCGDRWRVRVDTAAGLRPQGLTVGLVSGRRPLGPAVVGPTEFESWIAELRGPCQLPADAVVRATMAAQDGELLEETVPAHAPRGVHAWLRAAHRLPLAARPQPASLSRKETLDLARVFDWLACPQPPAAAVRDPGAAVHLNGCTEELASLLAEFDVEGAELDADLIEKLSRSV
ncbi:MAG: hypothetical protein EXR69_01140 [Myxococcales bacterium]|nr:hypothetical protein [Myxococcales bacterium]